MDKIFTLRIRQGLLLAVAAIACFLFVHPLAALLPVAPVIFGALTAEQQSDIIRLLASQRVLDPCGGVLLHVVAKTGNYTILDPYTTGGGDRSGTIFTNRGAGGAVVFTLPAPVARLRGCFYEFLGHADQNITIQTATVDTLIALNDVAADSIAMSTAGAKIGAHCRLVCDGTSWFAYGDAVGVTFTVAT